MKSVSIALAAAFGLLFAVVETGFAEDRPAATHGGKVQDKVKHSLPSRAAPRPAPETRGGTLDDNKGAIIFF